MKHLLPGTLAVGYRVPFLCLVVWLLVGISCSRDHINSSPSVSQAISVSSARFWFEKNSEKIRVVGSRGGRFSSMSPDWDKAYEGSSKSGVRFIEIPLRSEHPEFYVYKTPGLKSLSDSAVVGMSKTYQLVIYADEKGEYHESIKDISPSPEYLLAKKDNTNRARFSGILFLRNWSNEIVGGYSYENGAISGIISGSTNSGRTGGQTVCSDRSVCYWYSSCSQAVYGTTTETSSFSCPYPTAVPSGYACQPWQLSVRDRFTHCYVVDPVDPGPGPGTGPGEDPGPLEQNPCDHSKMMASDATWKSKWEDLKSKAGLNYEAAWVQTGSSYYYQAGTPNGGSVDINFAGPIDGFIHSHYGGPEMYDVFSAGDLLGMCELYKAGLMKDPSKFYMGVVTPTTSYMIHISDVQKFANWVVYVSQNSVQVQKFVAAYEDFPFYIEPTYNGAQNRKSLANYLKVSESGLQLLESNTTFTQWQTLSTTPNNESVIVYPCN